MEINKSKLVERLNVKMDLVGVFYYHYNLDEEPQKQLLVVVNPIKGISPATMVPIVQLCMSDMEEVPFEVVLFGDWLNHLRQGSLYHHFASLPENRLHFSHPNQIDTLLNKKVVCSLIEVGLKGYDQAIKQAHEYYLASANFADKSDFGYALYMMHQYVAIHIRAFYLLLGKQVGKSQNLEHLIRNIRSIAPELLRLFAYDGLQVERFRLLDQIYLVYKKQGQFDVSFEDYDFLTMQSVQLVGVLDKMVTTMASAQKDHQEKLASAELTEESKKVEQKPKIVKNSADSNESLLLVCEDFSGFPWTPENKKDANSMIQTIYRKHRPEQILLVNHHPKKRSELNRYLEAIQGTEHNQETVMHLVLLMKNRGPFRYVEQRAGSMIARIVYLNLDYVENQLQEGGFYANTVLKNSCLIAKKSNFEKDLSRGTMDWERQSKLVIKYCLHSESEMDKIIAITIPREEGSYALVSMLLNRMIDLGVRTYLKCAVGYIPERNSLRNLIKFSGSVNPAIMDVLFTADAREKQVMNWVLDPEIEYLHDEPFTLTASDCFFMRNKLEETYAFFKRLLTNYAKTTMATSTSTEIIENN